MRNNIYTYSEEASKKYGANLITLNNGKSFYTTAIFNSATYKDDSYLWKDKYTIYECSDSEVLNNQQTEHSKLIDSFKLSGRIVKHASNTDEQIKTELEVNSDFINSNKKYKYRKII